MEIEIITHAPYSCCQPKITNHFLLQQHGNGIILMVAYHRVLTKMFSYATKKLKRKPTKKCSRKKKCTEKRDNGCVVQHDGANSSMVDDTAIVSNGMKIRMSSENFG